MRDIQYQAFWYKDKIITHVDTISFLQGGIRVHDGCCHDGWIGRDCELREYTGLKDKNRKKIYEGDLIKVDDEHIYAISYRITDSGFVAGNIYGFDEWDLHYLSEFYEVIGNIYENQELLGGE